MSGPTRRSSTPAAQPDPTLHTRQIDAEPDVTWGRGGIDDWGWTGIEPALGRDSEPGKDKS